MHLELVELYRRVQGRVPLPSLELSADILKRHAEEARPLLRFEDIPLELTDLRLLVRQTADILRRHGALEDADYQRVQTLGRDMKLLAAAGDWYRSAAESHAVASVGAAQVHAADAADDPVVGQVLALAMRPFLSRCAEVLQQRPELAVWTHPHCALCGGEPDFAVITPAAERHLICGRCALRWKFEPLTCPYCRNGDRIAHHVIRDDRRAVPRLRVRRVQAVSEGVRRPARDAAGHADGRYRGDAAARRGSHAEGIFELGTPLRRSGWLSSLPPQVRRACRRRAGPASWSRAS